MPRVLLRKLNFTACNVLVQANKHLDMSESPLPINQRIEEIASKAGAKAVAVAVYDYETETGFSLHGDRWFHAASTIKVPVLVTVFDAIERGEFSLDSRLHVRNRFLSAVDGESFKCSAGRDANSAVQNAIGKTMRIEELATHMITTSSNLATNLLLDLVGLEAAQATLKNAGFEGIELRRGVEDEKAFEQGINNMVTANGLLTVFRKIEEETILSKESCDKMLDILHQQEFKSGIPAKLPSGTKVAHKTGEISTVAHDVGLVFLENRKPYALAILTEWNPDASGRQETVAKISHSIYKFLTEEIAQQAKSVEQESK